MYIYIFDIFVSFPIYGSASTFNMSTTVHKEFMLSHCLQLFAFLRGKESLVMAAFRFQRPWPFPKSCCHYDLNVSRKEMPR